MMLSRPLLPKAKISSSTSFRAARSCCAQERGVGSKSVFHFDVQVSVSKSTHAGIRWLRFRSRLEKVGRAPSPGRRETTMATAAERMRAHRERARRGLRRFTISVSADDLRVMAERGYEGAASADQDCRSPLSACSLVTPLPVSTEPAETVLQPRLRRDTGVSGPTVTPRCGDCGP